MKENITLIIKDIESTNKRKDGSILMSKEGKTRDGKTIPPRPYWLVKADTEEEGKVTWFSNEEHTQKKGDKITGNLETSTSEKDGKTYTNKNFTFPKKNQGVDPEEFRKVTNRLTTLELSLDRRFAEMKSELMLELKGKVQTTADYEKYTQPHPLLDNAPEDLPLDVYKDEDF